MMRMQWTTEQRNAIEKRGDNVLLAAAAGSGKTAVLVQRIIELVSKNEAGKKPIDVNKLLVLTFTEAAASEMKGKIAAAVSRALSEDPENSHLRKQALLMHSASISTIHAFCLNTLKNNIHLTDLPIDFTLVSEIENKIILKEALDAVLEKYYSNIDKNEAFKNLVVGYGGIKNDMGLRDVILALLKFSKSMPYPAQWLNRSIREYEYTYKNGKLSVTYAKQIQSMAEECGKNALEVYDRILKTLDNHLYEDHPYVAFFINEREIVRNLFEGLGDKDYKRIAEKIGTFKFANLASGVRKAEGEILDAQETIKGYRDIAKKVINDFKKIIAIEENELIDRICKIYPVLRTLKNIVLTVDRRYTREKRRRNYLDFNDLEHEALRLLADKQGKPTETALALREKYEEILIDEYQDTNNIQDTIFRVLSRDNTNIFMVGDLKQSIYKFRNAVPQLFSEKYDSYAKEENSGELIKLFKNFRSRDEVVNAINFIFKRIMSREIGDIEYDEEEYLVRGAEYPEVDDKKALETELHMICRDGEIPEGFDGEIEDDKVVLEARVAASRICEIIKTKHLIYDKKKEYLRPAEYRDIVILMRNTGSTAPVFEKVLSEWGIPVYTDVGRSYLNSIEVQTVLAYLQIIDNPRQDIPLIAVMRSPMWGFTADELAKIRTMRRTGCFYDALETSAEEGFNKAIKFLNELKKMRDEAEYLGVDKLIWKIYYEFGYFAYSGAQSRGNERQANLKLLFERASDFERTKLSGLFSFMNYIETIRSEGADLTPASIFGEGENVVRIMSIHKSKGLEFPIVLLADVSHKFNMMDADKNIIWHESLGIAADFIDTSIRVRYPVLTRSIISEVAKREAISEEMRLLYVALTRAREKIIIISSFKQSDKHWKKPIFNEDGQALAAYVGASACFRDWITCGLMMHPQAKELRERCGIREVGVDNFAKFNLFVKIYENCLEVPEFTEDIFLSEEKNNYNNTIDEDGLFKKLDYEYPGKALGDIPVKMSVSEVKRIKTDGEEYLPLIESLQINELAQLKTFSGAERGTVVHFIMQMADADAVKDETDILMLVNRLVSEKVISKKMADAVDCRQIAAFFTGELGNRIKNAARVEKEFSFYTEEVADEIYKNGVRNKILLQGTIDCFFVEKNNNVVLLDFKTDRVQSEDKAIEKAKKYSVQMKYYIKGLGEILKRPVNECYLYFLDGGYTIKVEI